MMHPKKWLMLFINIFGGTAVLGSYVQGILAHSGAAETLWGGVPLSIRPFYTAGMLLAAAGYFAFTYFILFRLDPMQARIFQKFGFGEFNALYAAILLPSALWMPLTFLAVEQSSLTLLWAVRLVLAAVGLASLGLLFSLLKVEPRQPVWAHRLAIIGSVAFCIQTVILDAIVWVANFSI
jgi:hypothetical protein